MTSAIIIYWAVLTFGLSGCLFAVWKGGSAERLAALTVVVNVALGGSTILLAPRFVEGFRLFNDGLAAAAMLILAVRYAAPWLGGCMLVFAGQFALHSYFIVMGLPKETYLHAVLNNLNFCAVIWCLIIGTAMAWRRRAVAARTPEPFAHDAAFQAAP